MRSRKQVSNKSLNTFVKSRDYLKAPISSTEFCSKACCKTLNWPRHFLFYHKEKGNKENTECIEIILKMSNRLGPHMLSHTAPPKTSQRYQFYACNMNCSSVGTVQTIGSLPTCIPSSFITAWIERTSEKLDLFPWLPVTNVDKCLRSWGE